MKTFTADGLKAVLAAHLKWLRGEAGGARAYLAGANLADANLARANLADANLARANLARANLAGANLARADLAGAYLADAYLADADLAGANLAGAYLARANLADADLARANLAGADLARANLAGANLAGANLAGADLAGADGLNTAKLPATSIVPAVGAFQAYKKLRNGLIAHLEIPADAKRVNAISSRKARVSRVKTLAILDGDGKLADVKSGRGLYDENTIYRVGRITKPDSFNDDIRVECSHGIHLWLTFQEAAEWNG